MDPTLTQRNTAAFIQERALQESLEAGVPSEEDLLKMAINAGAWSEEHQRTLDEADVTISRLKGEKAVCKHSVARKLLQRQINEARECIRHIRSVKEQFTVQSAEYLAQAEYIYYLMRETVRRLDGSSLWNSEEHFLQDREAYSAFFSFIAMDVASEGVMDTKQIRKLARSGEWRLFWTQGRENLTCLFDRSVSEMNINQRALVYWSKVYDIAFESYEGRPSDDVIENDERFDEWLQQYLAQRSEDNVPGKDQKLRRAKDHQEQGVVIDGFYIETCSCGVGTKAPKGLGLGPRHAPDCEYGTFREYTEEEKEKIVNDVYGRNPGVVRAIVGKEQKAIDKHGLVDERNLRGRNTRRVLGMASKVHPRMNK